MKLFAIVMLIAVMGQTSLALTPGLFPLRANSRYVQGVAGPHQQNINEQKVPTFEEAMAAYRKSIKRELAPEKLKTKKQKAEGDQGGYQYDVKEIQNLFNEDDSSTPGPTYLPVLLNMPTEPELQVQQTESPVQETTIPVVQETTVPQVQETTIPVQETTIPEVQETTTEPQIPETTTEPQTPAPTTTEPVQVQQTESPVQETTVDEFNGYELGVKGGHELTGPVGTKGSKSTKRNVGKGSYHKNPQPIWKRGKKIDPATPLLPSLRG